METNTKTNPTKLSNEQQIGAHFPPSHPLHPSCTCFPSGNAYFDGVGLGYLFVDLSNIEESKMINR